MENGTASKGIVPAFLRPLGLTQTQLSPLGFLRKVVAEIIATFLLVFVTCGSSALSRSDENKVSRLGASIAGRLIVTAMIYAVGHISGAHMNPAVTFAFAAVRHFPWKQVHRFDNGRHLHHLTVKSENISVCVMCRPISIGSMNPARSIGPAIASENYKGIWVYVVGPMTGSLVGAWSYSFIRVTHKPVHDISTIDPIVV
ncbi:aquaporin NIP2-1-like [Telopea speciosissima]|uniref:aquaporin NIP2-1-like n=1 Tax=Telopea speciosissima TaxID=54955 RepID=UPI001CC4ADF1|nr:aquaporin NIP2-1-like [Telopea speciosissima]